jgi:hypothetical protein
MAKNLNEELIDLNDFYFAKRDYELQYGGYEEAKSV